MRAITSRKQKTVKLLQCPICNRHHVGHPEYGPFCCTSCLQTAIRPLILAHAKAAK
jgi:hypothetical protein